MHNRYRLNFIVDEASKLIIVRPIGDMPATAYIDQLFDRYRALSEPWSYRRVNDLRRFEGHLHAAALAEAARRWAELTARVTYSTRVAVVSNDLLDPIRLPAISPQFPNETICLFCDFHEAVGWLLAKDADTYLAGLAKVNRRVDDACIVIS